MVASCRQALKGSDEGQTLGAANKPGAADIQGAGSAITGHTQSV